MSTASTIVFFGVRFELTEDEVTALEERTHPKLVAATQCGLKHYWGNFDAPGRRYLLFIGDRLGVLGLEDDREIEISTVELAARMKDTEIKLQRAGIVTAAALYLQWQADA